MTFAEEHLREDMETLVQGEAKQCTSQSEFIPLSLWTQFQYWMPSSDSPEHISNGVSPQVYIAESDVKLHLTSVLPQRFPVWHSVRRIDFSSCGPKPETQVTRTPQASQSKPVKEC
ncbi:hypothetical protein AVEN_20695-1 [Araneus ventricosus]|uniref:Uncharacterized protein n=1 Tax=Araneus ventricosus TaxID=182803 RepID=A0A4Y2KIE4_ARAVE|nr:hypothetical protein AVEN_20695-1 [Araneus ventricosus]